MEDEMAGISGRGHHLTEAAKLVIGRVYIGLKEALVQKPGTGVQRPGARLLLRGQAWEERLGSQDDHPLRRLVAMWLGIHPRTVGECAKQVKDVYAGNEGALDVATRGPKAKTVEDYRQEWSSVYEALVGRIQECRRKGETCTVHQLARWFWENYDFGEEEASFTYGQLHYTLKKLGFRFGAVHLKLKSGRDKPYVVDWTKRYAEKRVELLEAKSLDEVEAYIDETWLYQGETGKLSWFLDSRVWSKTKGVSNKWGFVSVMFSWYELDPDDPGQEPRRRFLHVPELMCTWRCSGKEDEDPSLWAEWCGNINAERYEEWMEKVCDWCHDK